MSISQKVLNYIVVDGVHDLFFLINYFDEFVCEINIFANGKDISRRLLILRHYHYCIKISCKKKQ